MSTVVLNNTWGNIDDMTSEHVNRVKMALNNTSDETLTITAGSPQSPGTNIAISAGTVPVNMTYDGNIQVDAGVPEQEMHFTASFSATSDTNNIVLIGTMTVNGTPQQSKVLRKITTGADVGALSFQDTFLAKGGDTIGFNLDIEAGTAVDITIKQGASWEIETFKKKG